MTTSTFRVALRRLVLAAALGALAGMLFYVDQQIIGGYEAQRSISDIEPLKGFWWHVSGGAAFAVALLIFAGVFQLWEAVDAWRRRRARDLRHSAYCDRYYDRRASRCICKAEAQNWTPAERRAAWRKIPGGRPQ